MLDRRNVLKIGATTLAGALTGIPSFGRNSIGARSAVQRAVFDERFEEGRAFAAELRSGGVVASGIRGDVAQLWYGHLRSELRQHRIPLAGLTDRASLFCLEELARDVDMRVIVRMDHIFEPEKPQPELGRTMAKLVSRFDKNQMRDLSAQKRTGPFSPGNKVALVSWILA